MINPVDIPPLRKSFVPTQSQADTLVTMMAAGFDRSLMRTVSYVVKKRLLPRDVDLDMLRDSMRDIFAVGWNSDPGSFFDFVGHLEKPRSKPVAGIHTEKHRSLPGGVVYRCQLPSTSSKGW